jgi:hypothetical protein
MLSYWVSFLAYPKLFGIKGFVVIVYILNYNLYNTLKFHNRIIQIININSLTSLVSQTSSNSNSTN